MSHIDEEFKCDGELVVHEPRGDEHALGVSKLQIAMTNSMVTKSDIIPIRDNRIVALVYREGNKIVSLALERSGRAIWHGSDHALEIGCRYRNFARDGKTDAIGSLRDGSSANHLCWRARDCRRSLRHGLYSIALAQSSLQQQPFRPSSKSKGSILAVKSSGAFRFCPARDAAVVPDTSTSFAADIPANTHGLCYGSAARNRGNSDCCTHPGATSRYDDCLSTCRSAGRGDRGCVGVDCDNHY